MTPNDPPDTQCGVCRKLGTPREAPCPVCGSTTRDARTPSELPPGWRWDPECVGAYRQDWTFTERVTANDAGGPTDAYPDDALLEPARREVIRKAWEAYNAHEGYRQARGHVRALLGMMADWGSEEDGIPGDSWNRWRGNDGDRHEAARKWLEETDNG